jgi:hypothetical protein
LLTTEAAQNWKHQSQRDRFAGIFDHGRMKTCCSRISSRPLPVDSAEILIATDLKFVADSFVKLQQARHTADYDNSRVWSRTQVWEMIVLAEDAMAAWSKISEKEIAQDYLLDLMELDNVPPSCPTAFRRAAFRSGRTAAIMAVRKIEQNGSRITS